MDLKIVIRQMLEKGLTREQVIENLKELGVSDAEKLFDEAVAGQSSAAQKQGARSIQTQAQDKSQTGESDFLENKSSSQPGRQGKGSVGLFKDVQPQSESESPAKTGREAERRPEKTSEAQPQETRTRQKEEGEISISELMESDGKSIFTKREEKPEAAEKPAKKNTEAPAGEREQQPEHEDPAAEDSEENSEEGSEKDAVQADEERELSPAESTSLQLQKELFKKTLTDTDANIDDKLNNILALLKALESINEKILDTDRRVLLRMK